MPLGPKWLAPGSTGTLSAFYRYLNVSFKQNSGEHFRATWPSLSFNQTKTHDVGTQNSGEHFRATWPSCSFNQTKTHDVGTQKNHLTEMTLLNTQTYDLGTQKNRLIEMAQLTMSPDFYVDFQENLLSTL